MGTSVRFLRIRPRAWKRTDRMTLATRADRFAGWFQTYLRTETADEALPRSPGGATPTVEVTASTYSF